MNEFLNRFVGKKVKLFLNNGYVKVGILESFDDISYNVIYSNNSFECINKKSVDTLKIVGGDSNE